MTARVGLVDSTVEVVPEGEVGVEAPDTDDDVLGEDARMQLMFARMRTLALRTRAEGFDD